MLADIRYWEKIAQKHHFAIPHFNVWNVEMLEGVMDASEQENSPVIISFGTGFIHNTIFEEYAGMMVSMAKHSTLPVITHWDHGRSFDIVKNGYDYGMNSVMRDASKLPFEENIAETKKVVDYFHPLNVGVEAELGHVADPNKYEKAMEDYQYTDPSVAKEFVDKTHCDSLAVAIGQVHGVYTSTPHLNFEVLEKVAKAVPVPLVLHGASGIPDEQVSEAVSMGICKVNIHTDLGIAAMKAANAHSDQLYLEAQKYVREAIKDEAVHMIHVLGSQNKADLRLENY